MSEALKMVARSSGTHRVAGKADSGTRAMKAFARQCTGARATAAVTIESLTPEASARRYHRVHVSGVAVPCVVMELPEAARAEAAKLPPTRFPFLNLQGYLAKADFPVPRVLGADLSRGLLALEDLGDETLERAIEHGRELPARQRYQHYERAVDLIVALQRRGAAHADPDCVAFSRRFDFKLLRWEIEHFREWILVADRKAALTPTDNAEVDAAFDALAQGLAAEETVLVHRDFQSRNLMVKDGVLRVIDFQDAMLGPCVYDLVALLRDSYVELPDALVQDLLSRYANTTGRNVITITEMFHRQTLQRKMKDAGRFVEIHLGRGNPAFLPAIPLTLKYVREALQRVPACGPMAEILRRHVPELRA